MWIYRTEKFEQQVKEFGIAHFVEGRAERISAARTRAQASRIAKHYEGFLVTRHQNLRLIGSVERLHDRDVFIWFEVLKRGDNEYKNFSQYHRTIRAQVRQDDLETWFKEHRAAEIDSQLPENLPQAFHPWLDPLTWIFLNSDTDDTIVYETANWISSLHQVDQVRWQDAHLLVMEVVSHLSDPSTEETVHTASRASLRVTAQRTAARQIFLCSITRSDSVDAHHEPLPDGEAALPAARRAYQDWVLWDDDLWFSIQRGDKHNLALSPEEKSLLARVAGQTAAGAELPMFINGQAGSGKSTMLAFIFAGLCKMQTAKDAAGRPMYITYNEGLLAKAREITSKILKAHYETSKDFSGLDIEDLFTTWHDYLLSILPEDKRDSFQKDRRVDYNDFSLAWEGHPGKLNPRRDGAQDDVELVWYVIRSLIKGSDAEDELTPEDYVEELARSERTVSQATFDRIYQNYYLQWYKPCLRDSGYWDDQDLTEAALTALDDHRPSVPIAALVVDEAQDFTRRELRLVTRTTVYSDYACPERGTSIRPPIVLAGDPLQTLSPTGFRWDSVKAGVFEEFRGLFGDRAAQPVLAELTKNYRSTQNIVGLANLIQLWRTYLFGLRDIRPQGAWSTTSDIRVPERFSLEQIDESKFIKFARDTPLIVPCEEGGEVAYVRADPTLSKMFPDADQRRPPDTVYSASRIKGLEFQKVVLYKFGEAATELSWTPVADGDERDLQAEYFFNKLYVAITRATQDLFAVDTKTGERALWKNLEHSAKIRLLDEALGVGISGFSADDLQAIELGEDFDVEGVREQNPRENAIKQRNHAMEIRSPYKMRMAASYFRRTGEAREADECEAYALEYEGDHVAAGKKFADAGKYAMAWDAWWKRQAWAPLSEISAEATDVSPIETAAANFMATENRVVENLVRIARTFNSQSALLRIAGPTWDTIVATICDESRRLRPELEADDAREVVQLLDTLIDMGFSSPALRAAELHLELGNRHRARQIVEQSSLERSPDRARLLQKIDGLPSGLQHLVEAGLHAEAIQLWKENGQPWSDEWTTPLMPAFAGPQHARERIDLHLERGEVESAAAAFQEVTWPRNSAHSPYLDRILNGVGKAGLADVGLDLIKHVVELRLGQSQSSEVAMASTLARGLAEHYDAGSNEPLQPGQQQALRSAVETLYEKIRFDKMDESITPAFGALLERAHLYSKATKLYLRVATKSKDLQLKQYCQRRYLAAVTEQLSDSSVKGADRSRLQQEQHEHASAWKLDIDQRRHQRVTTIGSDKPSAPVRPSGESGPLTWQYQPDQRKLDLIFEDEEIFARAKISLDSELHSSTRTEISTSEEGDILVQAGPHTATVQTSPDLTITLTSPQSADVLVVVARAVGRESKPRADKVAPTKRTAGSGQRPEARPTIEFLPPGLTSGIKAYKLADELGASLEDVNEIATSLGFKARQGDKKFTFMEAIKIRESFHSPKM